MSDYIFLNESLANEQIFGINTYAGSLYFATRNQSGTEFFKIDTTGIIHSLGKPLGVDNIDAYGLVEFKSHLYIGTYNQSGAEIWTMNHGLEFKQIAKLGIQNQNNIDIWSMIVFQNSLYAGTWNPVDGGELYKTEDGVSFRKIMGLNDPNKDYIRSMAVFQNKLFISIGKRDDQLSLISIDADETVSYIETPLAPPLNDIYNIVAFDDALYLTTGAHKKANHPGCEIWKYKDNKYTQVASAGFGNINNKYILSFEKHNDLLLFGTYNIIDGCEIYAMDLNDQFYKVIEKGINNDPQNESTAKGLKSFNQKLFVGTRNETTGLQLFEMDVHAI